MLSLLAQDPEAQLSVLVLEVREEEMEEAQELGVAMFVLDPFLLPGRDLGALYLGIEEGVLFLLDEAEVPYTEEFHQGEAQGAPCLVRVQVQGREEVQGILQFAEIPVILYLGKPL